MICKITPNRASYDALQKRLEEMGKGESAEQGLRSAVNAVSKDIKDQLYLKAKERYTIKPAVFHKADIKRSAATGKRPQAVITVRGSTLGLRKGYRTKKNGKKKGAGAMVIKAGTMRNLELRANGRTYKAFIATMKTGHEGIFQRVPGSYMKKATGKKRREKIRELISMSKAKAAEMVYQAEIEQNVQAEINYQMLKHMNAVIGA